MTTGLRYASVSVRALLVLTLILGVFYPLSVLAVGQVAFHSAANGSLVNADGTLVGSSLLGQPFAGDEWFHPRPSAAGDGYDGLASGASNLGPSSEELLQLVEERRATAAGTNGVDPSQVPADALTASGSGLDPHISPEYARQQVARVAATRGLDPDSVRRLVDESIDERTLGFLGEPTVNVLELNLALRELAGALEE
jgi:K+-transporting ATPase ATPase C chain